MRGEGTGGEHLVKPFLPFKSPFRATFGNALGSDTPTDWRVSSYAVLPCGVCNIETGGGLKAGDMGGVMSKLGGSFLPKLTPSLLNFPSLLSCLPSFTFQDPFRSFP